jgi:hypothetical protein
MYSDAALSGLRAAEREPVSGCFNSYVGELFA